MSDSFAPPQILVSTMNDLPGYEVVTVYGEVFGLVVRSRNMFSNIVLAMRFDTGLFASVMNEVAAYGTAVTVRPLA